MKFNGNAYLDEYLDSYVFTKEETKIFDIDAMYENMKELLFKVKIARNRYINGIHTRVTSNYEPKIEMFVQRAIDSVGDMVCNNIDSEQEYNEFNVRLNKLYITMSKLEVAFINDCVIDGESDHRFYLKLGLTRTDFEKIKLSSIVRFCVSFDIVVYK